MVNLKHTYERLHREFWRYTSSIPRDTDAGGKSGKVIQTFKGFHPMFLGVHEEVWYSVLYGSYYNRSRDLPGQDWGELEDPYGQWAIKLVEGKWIPISMGNLPPIFEQPNMLILKGSAAEHAEFNGTRVTLRDKQAWLENIRMAMQTLD